MSIFKLKLRVMISIAFVR